MATQPHIAIVGGGPGGLMLARLLHLRGIAATVFEGDSTRDARPQGGSLDLHAETGQRAMRLAQLDDAFQAAARPEDQGDRLYDADGTLLFDHDGHGLDRPEIDRSALRNILLDSLPAHCIRWNSRIERIAAADQGGGHVVTTAGGSDRFDIVVGADGGWSRVRPLLSPCTPGYEGVALIELGFKTAVHPAIEALVGSGKMFAVGDNRVLIAQRNGRGQIRGYAGMRMTESAARELAATTPDQLRATMRAKFADWAAPLTRIVEDGEILGVRPMYALPVGHRWVSRPGLTLLGDAAHLMSPFSGEGVNLALADATDLADALTATADWDAVEASEVEIVTRATPAAARTARAMSSILSAQGAGPVLAHYRHRIDG